MSYIRSRLVLVLLVALGTRACLSIISIKTSKPGFLAPPSPISSNFDTSYHHQPYMQRRRAGHTFKLAPDGSKPSILPAAGRQEAPPQQEPSWAEEFSWGTIVNKMSTQTTSRVLALKVWLIFIWFTFLSPYAPGPVPSPLDWAVISQVGGLTLNYFCILPTILPTVAPVFSPVMEGVFNLLLAWSVLFSGFLVDGRKKGWSTNVFAPFMAAMVVLTNTAYLPYIMVRPLHDEEEPTLVEDDVPLVERQLGESRGLLAFYGAAGLYSIGWGFFGRPEFGGLAERLASFQELVSSDRLMFAFVVELVLFGLFQGVMVDDDMRRRRVSSGDEGARRLFEVGGVLAKFVPFLGLLFYFLVRPPLPSSASPPPPTSSARFGKRWLISTVNSRE